MRKKLSIIFLLLTLAALAATACSGVKDNGFPDYDFTNPEPPEIVYDTDEGVTLDGRQDEDFWKSEHNYYTTEFSDGSKGKNPIVAGHLKPCEMKVTTHFSDKGVYFYAEVGDPIINVYREKRDLAAYQKTGISLYVAEPGMISTSDGTGAYEFALAVDGTSLLRRHYRGGYNAYPLVGVCWGTRFINPDLDEHGNGTADGYAMEAFIPWLLIKLDGKPEYLNVAFATQRHETPNNAGSEFSWEWNPLGQADWYKPDTWLKFTENGLYKAKAADKVIDGSASDWADYDGETKRLNFPDGVRYVEHKITRGSDGLYVLTDAVQRLYLTEKEWWENTSIEVLVANKYGNSVSYALDGAGYSAPYTEGVMKAEDVTKNGATYKHITAEYFIPDFALGFGAANKSDDGVDTSGEYLRVSVAFANGTGQKTDDGALDPEYNESVDKSELIKDACLNNKPYLVYPLGCDPWNAGRRLYVNSGGITAGTPTADPRFTVDGNADDWKDYRGVTARAIGRAEGDDTSSVGKGFDVKAVKGTDGVYFYATVSHNALDVLSKDKYDVSGLTVKFSVTDTNFRDLNSGDAQYKNGRNGWETYFTAVGVDAGAECASVMRTTEEADGTYRTIIEGFVPFWKTGDLDALKTTDGKPAFDKTTGKLADGYVLRVGFRWRTKGDKMYIQGNASATDGLVNGMMSLNNPQNHYIIDENGLHQSRLVPEFGVIDGKSDGGAYYGETLRAESADGERYSETRAIMREDGLYTITVARVKNYVETASTTVGWDGVNTGTYKNNSAVELRYVKDGKNLPFASIAPMGASNATSWVPEVEYEYNVTADGEYNLVTVEAFFNKHYLKAKTGSELPVDLVLSAAFYVHDGNADETKFAPPDYGTATSVTPSGGLYAVTSTGLVRNAEAVGKTAIFDGNVTDNIRNGEFDGMLEIVVAVNGVTLEKGRDYVVTVEANEKGGAYTVEGRGDYYGKVVREFNGGAKSVENAEIECAAEVEYSGNVSYLVTYLGEPLSTDYYDVTVGETDSLGKKEITIIGKGLFYGSKTVTFTVVPKDVASGVSAAISTVLAGGETPVETVKHGDITLRRGADYEIDFGDLTSGGTKTATIVGKGNYGGTLEVEFVVLSESIDLASDSIAVTATAAKYYEPDGEFMPETLTVTYNDGATSVTLNADSDYTLGSVAFGGEDGGTATLAVIGNGLFGGTRNVTYTINLYRHMTNAKLGVQVSGELTYTGEAITPDVTVTWDGETLTEGEHYELEITDNVNAGEAKITITGMGERYKSSAAKSFTINPRDIASASLSVPDGLKHTGREIKPTLTVKDGATKLASGTDYTVTYSGDCANLVSDTTGNYGEAAVTAVGKGNYTGTAKLTYRFYTAATAKRVDGNKTDWADYDGNTSVIYNAGNTKGAEIIAKHEADGVYVFATVRHATLVKNSNNPQNDTHLRVIFALQTGTSCAAGDQIYVGANGNYKYWSKNYDNYYDNVESAFVVTGEAGNYVTYVEVFVPASNLTNVTDGTDLRVIFSWYAPGESETVFGFNNGTTWGPMKRWANAFSESNAKNFYYLDKNTDAVNRGLRYSKYVAADRVIDGDISDWADYDEAGGTVKRTEGSNGRYIEYRAYYGADGTYLSTKSLTDKVVIGNRAASSTQKDLWKIYFYNTSWEFKLGGKDMGMAYGYQLAYDNNKLDLAEFAMKCEKQANGQYLTGMEMFIPSAAYEELGLTLTDGKPTVSTWIFGCKKATDYVVTEYEQFKTEAGKAASSWAADYQWFGGNYQNNDSAKSSYFEIIDYVKAA